MDKLSFLESLHLQITTVRQQLEMATGIVSYINNNLYTIVDVDSEMEGVFSVGMQLPLADTYCKTVKDTDKLVSYHHVGSMEYMLQHPVYLSVKLESYISAPIHDTNGDVIGTVNFTSLDPQKQKFNNHKVDLVNNLALFIENNIADYKKLIDEI